MATFYSVIQYVPDAVLGERVNIGVVVFGEGQTRSHFLSNWKRVKQFSTDDVVGELKEFCKRIEKLDSDAIRSAAQRWSHAIQLTSPAGSLLDTERLLFDAAKRFLIDPPRIPAGNYLVKSKVVDRARRRLREALKDRIGGTGPLLLKEQYEVPGHFHPQSFDLAVANGHPYTVAEVVSFQGPDAVGIYKAADAAAFAIDNVRRAASPTAPALAVIVAPPINGNPDGRYAGALRAFAELNAEIVEESKLDEWAGRVADLAAAG